MSDTNKQPTKTALGRILTCLVFLSGQAVLAQTGAVAINNPLNGQKFPAGGKLAVTANPQITGGAITSVEFYVKGGSGSETKLDEDSESPFQAMWDLETPGTYTLRAVASGDNGARIETPPVTVSVFPPKLGLTAEETFDAGLSAFTWEVGNHENGNDFGFSDTAQAGGQPGELGGTLARSSTDARGTAGTSDLKGALLPAKHNLYLRGRFKLVNVNFDGSFSLGYVRAEPFGNLIGISFAEPGGGFQPNFRGFAEVLGTRSPFFGVAPKVEHEFCLFWNARERTLRGTLAGQAIAISRPTVDTALTVDALAVGAWSASTNPNEKMELYVDDLTYNLYDPATANDPVINVAVTAPVAYTAVRPGTSIALEANASVDVGQIAKVEYYATVGNTTNKIGEATAAPYAATWSPSTAGHYLVKAVATTAGAKSDESVDVPLYVVAPVTTQTLEEKFATDFVQGIMTLLFSFMLLPFIMNAVGWMDGIRTLLEPEHAKMLSLLAPGKIGVFWIVS